MTELDNLAKIGKLKIEPASAAEIQGLVRSGAARLKDAGIDRLSVDSRFDLVYNAAHALSHAALRRQGFRSDSRYLVFQCLEHTLGLPAEQWRVLEQAHRKRNIAEYEGDLDVDPDLVAAMIRVTTEILARLSRLKPVSAP